MSSIKTNTVQPKKIISSVALYIKQTQLKNGAIPWYKDHKLDPWDHSEAIMALTMANELECARAAFSWLENTQNKNGTWYAKYLGDINDGDSDRFKVETNFVAYPATALWHAYLCTLDKRLITDFFPMVERAIDYVVNEQHTEGDIQWASSSTETLPNDALVTASSSITRSLECAICLSETLGITKDHWIQAHSKLAEALKTKPWRFDRTWESKARFSMDWFYPILSGIYSETEAKIRIAQSEKKFIVENYGCKCVSDEPWVTIAESCELVMALLVAGERKKALELFTQLQRWQDTDGGYWTGYQYQNKCIWPKEKTTWTAAAVSLACDALFDITPASQLFTKPSGLFFP